MHLQQIIKFFQNRHIKRSTTQIDNNEATLILGFLNAVGQRSGRWLIDQSINLESCKSSCIQGSGALMVVKIGGHTDDGLGYRHTEKHLGISFELLEH